LGRKKTLVGSGEKAGITQESVDRTDACVTVASPSTISEPENAVQVPCVSALIPAECEFDATDAVALLDAYNAIAGSDVNPIELAIPSSRACKWCPYKLVCTAFWSGASPEWSDLDGAAVEGLVCETPQRIHGGAAVAISIEVERGTETPRTPESHRPHSRHGRSKRRKSATCGIARPDGGLTATSRTLLIRIDDIPNVCSG
jgi:hypothetical protein